MSGSGPTVGSAFVEVHARAAANLEGEMRVETERAAKRVQATAPLPSIASGGSASTRRAEREFGAGSQEALAAQQAFEERGAAFSARLAAQRARVVEDAETKVRKQVRQTADEHETASRREARSVASTSSALLQGASAYLIVDTAVRALTGTVGAFLKQGDEGRLKSEADVRAYRELANGLDELGTKFDEAKLKIGSFIATDINPFSTKFAQGVEALKNPLDTVSAFLGRSTNGTRDLAAAFAALDAAKPAETLAETARAAERTQEAFENTRRSIDARTDATVRAVGLEFEFTQAQERLWESQVRLNEARSNGADDARQLADAERSIHEAREAAADAAQAALDRDRDLAEARRTLAETSFRTGSQSQDTKDAADAVQKAEFDAQRAHEEAGDAVADVAKAERDAATVRVKASTDVAQAERDVRDAQRDVANSAADLKAAQLDASGAHVTAAGRLALYGDELAKFSQPGGTGPTFRTELERIKAALDALAPSPEFLAALGQVFSLDRPAAGPPPGFVDPGPATPITLTPPEPAVPVVINNTYNTPVDPAQIAREQAAQIGGSGVASRVI